MVLLSTWYYDILALVSVVFLATFLFFKHRFKYWEKLGVPCPWTPVIPYGHFKGINTKKSMVLLAQDMYNASKNERFVGAYLFGTPVFLVRDLDLVKTMLVKEFSSFHDRGIDFDTSTEPLLGNLFSMNGQPWRNMRAKLTPTFTSGKMKMMFATLVEVGKQFEELLGEVSQMPEVEIKDILARYNTDIIASCAFGIEGNALKDPNTKFRVYGRQMVKPNLQQIIANIVAFMWPQLFNYLPIRFFPKEISDFFIGIVRSTMQYREDNNVHRNDFLQMLLQLKNTGYIKDVDNPHIGDDNPDLLQKFTFEQAAAQAFLFFFAGFETASTTMQFSLYELALNPPLQKELQDEIDETNAKCGGKLTFEVLQEMKLLDRVVSETLRKYTVAPVLIRQSNTDFKVPGTDITIPVGTAVWFPIGGYHNDEKYYPNPDKFDPDRFLPEEVAKRNHYAYLPFGEGPRNCIGNRFALMQCKVGLFILLAGFTVSPSKKTPIPIIFDPKTDILTPKGDMYLKLSKRK